MEAKTLYFQQFSGRLKGGRRKIEASKQRVKTLAQHKNLRSMEIKYQPDDQTHWKEFFAKYLGKVQLWRLVKRSYTVVPSLCVNMGRGEVSNAARNAPVPEMTLGLGRLHITMCDPVATTTRRVQRRVKRNRRPTTLTSSQVAPRLNSTDDDVQSTKHKDDTVQELKEQHKGTSTI
jgi:hypothetical protein